MIKKISRKAPLFMAACMAFALVLAGCDNSSSPTRIYHTVTFNTHGGSAVTEQEVRHGETARRPADPARSGFTLTNWFTAQTGGSVFNFSTEITGDTTIHAQWQPAQVVITITGLSQNMMENISAGGMYLTLYTWGGLSTPVVYRARGEGSTQGDLAIFPMFAINEGEITNQPFTSTGPFYVSIGDSDYHWLGTIDTVNITGGNNPMTYASDYWWID